MLLAKMDARFADRFFIRVCVGGQDKNLAALRAAARCRSRWRVLRAHLYLSVLLWAPAIGRRGGENSVVVVVDSGRSASLTRPPPSLQGPPHQGDR